MASIIRLSFVYGTVFGVPADAFLVLLMIFTVEDRQPTIFAPTEHFPVVYSLDDTTRVDRSKFGNRLSNGILAAHIIN